MHWGVYALFRPRGRGSLGLNGAIVSLRPLAGYGDRPGQGDSNEFIELAKRVRNFSKRGNINGAISTLKHIKKIGYSWNSHLYLHLMEAYGYHKRWKEAMNVFRQIPNPNMYHYTYMLALYGRLGKTKEGMSLFKEMVNSGIEPGIIAYNSLLLGVAKAGEVDKVDIIFKEIKKSGLVPTGITYNTLVHLHARRGDSKAAMEIVGRMRAQGVEVTGTTLNSLLHAFVNEGNLDAAVSLFRTLLGNQDGVVDDAADIVRIEAIVEAVSSSSLERPSLHTFALILTAFARARMVDHAEALFTRLKESGLIFNRVVYNALIDANVKSNRMDRALEVIEEMRICGLGPSATSYANVMLGYAVFGDTKIVQHLLDEMTTRDSIQPIISNYNALALAHVRRGEFEEAREVIENLRIPGNQHTDKLRRTSGCNGVSEQIVALCETRMYRLGVEVSKNAQEKGLEVSDEAARHAAEAQVKIEAGELEAFPISAGRVLEGGEK
uniref:Pentacotripeptide-repeat region of PRORP domain-containing protein n=1 Tax=Rhodosorus marinus TaxID=101924 RepID=A0A7S2ZNK8_9RHOD|mmetsp:Transcript_26310/g.102762  ORF Transcript_26310/g.102762 Transcript_26310/m.102762 type:complete len:494 (+) Transcript_26310:184-1665(+)